MERDHRFIGTPLSSAHTRPKWLKERSGASHKRPPKRQRRQPGPLEEALAAAPPPAEVVPVRARADAGYALLRASGWRGHAGETGAAKAREAYDTLAPSRGPREVHGLGFAGATSSRRKEGTDVREVAHAPDVFEEGGSDAEADGGGLDAATARMQLALNGQLAAVRLARASASAGGASNGRLFSSFAPPSEANSIAGRPGLEIFVDGKVVQRNSLPEAGPLPPDAPILLPKPLQAAAKEAAESEERRERVFAEKFSGVVRKFEEKRDARLEAAKKMSASVLKGAFVSAGTGSSATAGAGVKSAKAAADERKPRVSGDVRRTMIPWQPAKVVCKRFGVPLPKVQETAFVPKPETPADFAQVSGGGGEGDEKEDAEFEICAIMYADGGGGDKREPAGAEGAARPLFKAVFETPGPDSVRERRPVPCPAVPVSRAEAAKKRRKSRFKNANWVEAKRVEERVVKDDGGETASEDDSPPVNRRKVTRAVDFF